MTNVDTIEQNFELREAVMRRVRFMHFIRAFARPVYIELASLFLAMAAAGFMVSVGDIASNVYRLPHITHCLGYLSRAFLETEFSVQAIVVLGILSAAFLAKDSFRNFRSAVMMKTA